MGRRAIVSVIIVVAFGIAGCGLPLHNPGGYADRDWPVAPNGYSSYTVDTTVDRDPGSDIDTRYYLATYWDMQVSTGDPLYAYMGLQTWDYRGDGSVGRMAIVSLWTRSDVVTWVPGTGTDGKSAACERNDGEGWHVQCRIAYDWQQGHTYRYSFAKTGASQWTAQVTDRTAVGAPVTRLGTFTVPSSWQGVLPAGSWVEQYVSPPETTSGTPVCPSRWTTVRYENARVNGSIAPTTDHGRIADINAFEPADGAPPDHIVCQNATATDTGNGVTLDVDTPNPAPVNAPALARSSTSAVISWIAPRNPATITAKELADASGSASALAALSAIVHPLPTSYTVTASPGNHSVTVVAPTTRATITGLISGTPYTFTVRAKNAGRSSVGATVQG